MSTPTPQHVCEDCARLTSGRCGMHASVVYTTGVEWPVPQNASEHALYDIARDLLDALATERRLRHEAETKTEELIRASERCTCGERQDLRVNSGKGSEFFVDQQDHRDKDNGCP